MSDLLRKLREEQEHYEDSDEERYGRVKEIADHVSSLEFRLGSFVEYFDAIEKGEYVENGRASRIRIFERILIDSSKVLLGRIK